MDVHAERVAIHHPPGGVTTIPYQPFMTEGRKAAKDSQKMPTFKFEKKIIKKKMKKQKSL